MATAIQLRRDTYANWIAADPIIGVGEPTWDTTNDSMRVGDGIQNWSTLIAIANTGGVPSLTDIAALTVTAVPDDAYIVFTDPLDSFDKRLTRDQFTSDIILSKYLESIFDMGSILVAETATPNIDTNGVNHTMTIAGDCTIAVPVVTLPAGKMVSGMIEVIAGSSYNITWGSSYDWGSDGLPTITGTALFGYSRISGNVKTRIWVKDGFS